MNGIPDGLMGRSREQGQGRSLPQQMAVSVIVLWLAKPKMRNSERYCQEVTENWVG